MEKKYFYGNQISDYGVKNNRVDFLTLSKSFDCVLANEYGSNRFEYFIDYIVNGCMYEIDNDGNEIEDFKEIFQWYIVSDNAIEILKEANELVFYDSEMDLYIWAITHYGTSWDYVLSDIEITW